MHRRAARPIRRPHDRHAALRSLAGRFALLRRRGLPDRREAARDREYDAGADAVLSR